MELPLVRPKAMQLDWPMAPLLESPTVTPWAWLTVWLLVILLVRPKEKLLVLARGSPRALQKAQLWALQMVKLMGLQSAKQLVLLLGHPWVSQKEKQLGLPKGQQMVMRSDLPWERQTERLTATQLVLLLGPRWVPRMEPPMGKPLVLLTGLPLATLKAKWMVQLWDPPWVTLKATQWVMSVTALVLRTVPE